MRSRWRRTSHGSCDRGIGNADRTPSPEPETRSMNDSDLNFTEALDDVVARLVAIAGLGGVALAHVLQLGDAFAAIDYLGVLFVAAIVACVVLATLLTRMSGELVWAATGALAALVLIG